ncbi:MAG TPA: lysylphosphatidylglycerol synthase domain-containing protein [Acidimicrobiales bacterium]|jgi:uncharacterized membrane protein YbhN (UPF0104 family)|nr:lysylphosphatidylglycerol synthase domain-containing protein [Acidimicrobiales bacterium]
MTKIHLRNASPRVKTALLVLLAIALYVSASAGVSDIAGFSVVARRIDHVTWPWLLVTVGSITLGLVAYSFAWTGIVDVEDGPMLSRTERVTTAIIGFGGFLARGGSTVDRHVFRSHGLKKREINVRLVALDALEHAPLAIGCCALAIFQLVRGSVDPPPLDFVWPWAVIPPIGAAVAIWCTVRYRDRFRGESGFFRLCGIALDSFYLLSKMVTARRVRGLPYLTMTAYWCAELFALWSALAAFGFRMSMPNLVFAYVAAYVITRRPAPFGGAGPLDLLLPLSLWWCGAPLGAAVAATIAFRFISLWLPFPIAIRGASAIALLGKGGFPEPEPALAPST